jgi:hypothetical protein
MISTVTRIRYRSMQLQAFQQESRCRDVLSWETIFFHTNTEAKCQNLRVFTLRRYSLINIVDQHASSKTYEIIEFQHS